MEHAPVLNPLSIEANFGALYVKNRILYTVNDLKSVINY